MLLIGLVLFAPGAASSRLRNLVGLGPEPLGQPPVVSGQGTYTFLQHQPHDRNGPVAWGPCKPVHYEVNPAQAPGNAAALIPEAIEQVSGATGLKFVYDGLTDRRPKWDTSYVPKVLGGARPVLISWATESEVSQLAGRVAGIGGGVAKSGWDGALRYVSGGVTLDADSYASLETRPDGRAEQRAILLHELGHLVGLGHVSDARELMYQDNVGLLDYAAGDQLGLAALGRGSCG